MNNRYKEAFNSTRTTASSSMLPFLTQSSMMSLNTHAGNVSPTRDDPTDPMFRLPNKYGVSTSSVRQEAIRGSSDVSSLAGLRAKIEGSPTRMAEIEKHEYDYYGESRRKKRLAQLPTLNPSGSLPTLGNR